MSHVILERVCAVWPPDTWRDVTVVVAVSGGPDSVALLRVLHVLKQSAGGQGTLMAAHFNHRLRGPESDADQVFVLALCRQLVIPCDTNIASQGRGTTVPNSDIPAHTADGQDPREVGTNDAPAALPDEDSAREARYEFLRQVVACRGARFLVTAHTRDDQAETVMHRIVRGTGLDGLAGIPVARELISGVTLMRPLLTVGRHEVIEFLRELEQPYCEDSTNTSLRYTRNRLRHDLFPRIEQNYNPRVKEAICRLATLAREATEFAREQASQLQRRAVLRVDPRVLVLDCGSLATAPPYLVRQLLMRMWELQGWPLRDMSLEKWSQIAELIMQPEAGSNKMTAPGGLLIERDDGRLQIRDSVGDFR